MGIKFFLVEVIFSNLIVKEQTTNFTFFSKNLVQIRILGSHYNDDTTHTSMCEL